MTLYPIFYWPDGEEKVLIGIATSLENLTALKEDICKKYPIPETMDEDVLIEPYESDKIYDEGIDAV